MTAPTAPPPVAPLPTLPAPPAMHPVLADVTDDEWLTLSSRFTALAGFMSGRRDVIAKVGPGFGRGAPACFIPSLAEIEVNAVACIPQSDIDRLIAAALHPADLDVVRRDHRLITPAATGALGHEAGHASHSLWNLPEGTAGATAKAAALIEEPRQEKRYLSRRPDDRVFLRSCVLQIVAPGFTKPAPASDPVRGRWDAAKAATLLCARADSGMFTDAEVAPVREQAVAALGQDDYDLLRQVWIDAFDLDDRDGEGMAALAVRWCEIVGADPEDDAPDGPADDSKCGGMPSDGSGDASPESGDADPSDETAKGSGDGSGSDSESDSDDDASGGGAGEPDPLAEAIAAAVAAISEDADEAVEQETADAAAAAAAGEDSGPSESDRRAADAADREAGEAAADRVFKHGYSATTGKVVFTTRQPTPHERNNAADMARELGRAKYRDRARTTRSTALPPGRLQPRQAILGAALRAQGLRDTSTPWKSTTYARVEDPPLTVAIALDKSGSMRWAEKPLSSAAWVVAEAADRVQGRSATVTFGHKVDAIMAPGERPDVVREFTADAGSEAIHDALVALDGALNLTRGTGARVVVVVTDGIFVDTAQDTGCTHYVQRLVRAGCVVLFVSFRDAALTPAGAIPVTLTDPSTAGTLIGRAAADALTNASA